MGFGSKKGKGIRKAENPFSIKESGDSVDKNGKLRNSENHFF